MNFVKTGRGSKIDLVCTECGKPFKGGFNRDKCDSCNKPVREEYVPVNRKVDDDNNVVIEHEFVYKTTVSRLCAHCNKPYTVDLLPRVFIYPKNCIRHRFPAQR